MSAGGPLKPDKRSTTRRLPHFSALARLLARRPSNLEATLIAVLESAFEELDGERAAVLLMGAPGEEPVSLALQRGGERTELEPAVAELAGRVDRTGLWLAGSEAPPGRAWCALQPLAITVREREERESELRKIRGEEVSERLGVLVLDGTSPRQPFSPEETAILRALAQHAATAVIHCRLYQKAVCDELTGLIGRAELERLLEQELAVARSRGLPLSFVYLDVDRMKTLNERLGFQAGDRVLQQVARVIEHGTRQQDTCARHGGARFALVLPETDQEGAKTLGTKLVAAVKEAFADEERVTVCAGAATFPEHGEDGASLKESADRALYSAKKSGPGTFRLHNRRTRSVGRFDKLAGIYTGRYARDYRNMALVLETLGALARRAPDELARYALPRLIEAAEAERGAIFLQSPDGPLAPAASLNDRGQSQPPGPVPDEVRAALEERASPDPLARGACTFFALPGSESLLGVLRCDYPEGRAPDAECLAFVTVFCELIAQALENVLLLRTLESQRNELAEKTSSIEKLYAQLGEKLASREQELERLRAGRSEVADRASLKHPYTEIIGGSRPMIAVLAMLDKVVESEVAVLIQGESGTGKELIARAIHMYGPRQGKPFVSENCAALTETLLESELFGYVKGAFTGAAGNKKGLFEVADGGTLFLDEVGDMSPNLQKKLLRALQEGEIRPVGSKSVRHVDVRIISATNRELKKMLEDGTFREDLFYRLNVVNILLPPLRERKEDIPLLVNYFMKSVAEKFAMPAKRLAPQALEFLVAYDWPGNIREMQNEVNRMLFMGDDPITPDVLSEQITRRVESPRPA